MKLTRLELNNYKIYYGQQIFDLSIPTNETSVQKKNLILIGGLNGRGKTTVLNAIYYALFGKQGLTNDEYNLTFSGAINDRYYSEGGRECSVSLSFEDESEHVTIHVTWTFDSRKTLILENRNLFINEDDSNELKEIHMSNEEYFEFINKRIPYEVAQFFIFDGEKIQNLVEKQDHKLMKQSIQKIVSIDIYRELVQDLTQLQSSLEKKLSSRQTNRKLSELEVDIESNKEKLDRAQSSAKQLEMEVKQLDSELLELNVQRRKKLANNSESQIQINNRINEYTHKLNTVNKSLADFSKKELAKYLLSPLINKLQQTLQSESEYINQKNQSITQFAPYDNFINKLMGETVNPPLTEEQINQIKSKGKDVWAELNRIRQKEIPNREVIHDISPGSKRYILSLFAKVNQNIRTLLDQKLQLERLLKQSNEQLENAPDPIDTTEEDQKISVLYTTLGEKNARLKSAKTVIMRSNKEIETLRKQYTFTEETASERTELHAQYEELRNIKLVAEKFVEEVTELKAQKIKYEFSNILERLVQKEQEFQDVEFSDKDFIIRIYNDQGTEVKLSDRSAGEKQIIALSFIWALTKTAGLKLPFVIDTPLGRLDSIHRSHIIRHYFNLLSDQVIILSTDTEITNEYHQQVQNYLVRSYQLVYNPAEKSTSIKEGYFSFK